MRFRKPSRKKSWLALFAIILFIGHRLNLLRWDATNPLKIQFSNQAVSLRVIYGRDATCNFHFFFRECSSSASKFRNQFLVSSAQRVAHRVNKKKSVHLTYLQDDIKLKFCPWMAFVFVKFSFSNGFDEGIPSEKKSVCLWMHAERIAYGFMSNKEFCILWIFEVLLPLGAAFVSSFLVAGAIAVEISSLRDQTNKKVVFCIRFHCKIHQQQLNCSIDSCEATVLLPISIHKYPHAEEMS